MAEEEVDEESISWDEEWTILEEDESTNLRDCSPGVDVAEEALRFSSLDASSLSAVPTDTHDQESDGVSVISESSDDDGANTERIVSYRLAERKEDTVKEEVVTRINLLIVCCLLLTTVGIAKLGTRIYFETERPCGGEAERVTRDTDNERVTERASTEFCRVEQHSLAKEVCSSVTEKERRHIDSDDRIVYPFVERYETEEESSSLSNRLQIFLRTMCHLLGDIPRVCDTRSLFSDVSKLRILLKNAIGDTDGSIKSKNDKFIEKMEHRLASIDDAFVADLTRALDKTSSKNERRLKKIREKIKERLCLLRMTMHGESMTGRPQRWRSLEADDAFLEYCDETTRKILTVERSVTKETPSVLAPNSDNSKRQDGDGYSSNVSEERLEASWRILVDRDEGEKHRRAPFERKKSVKKKAIREREEEKKRKRNSLLRKASAYLPFETSSDSDDELRRDPVGSRPRRNKNKRKNHEADESNASSDTSDEEQQSIAANGQWQFARSRIRDELRKEEALENWYFDRMRNRKTARMNLNNLGYRR